MTAAMALAANRPPTMPVHQQLKLLVDERLERLMPADAEPQPLVRAMRHVLLSPGKRLRPLLVLMGTAELGGDALAALEVGCALEMVHAASLVLDDLPCMDDASLRRGQPTTHLVYGEDVAVLASIALLSRAFGLVACQRHLDPMVRAELSCMLSACIGTEGLVAGQLDDLRGGRAAAGLAAVEHRHLRKTGALFVAAIESAAAIAGPIDEPRLACLRDFAKHLGIAFQCCDDLLDATRSSAALGKDVGKDAGKSTVVSLLGIEGARRTMHLHLARAHAIAGGPLGRNGVPGPLAEFLDCAFGPELQAALA